MVDLSAGDLVTALIEALVVGLAFGFLLQKAGLSRYERIVNVYRFRDAAVLKFLLTAVVTGALGIRTLTACGLGDAVPIPATLLAGNVAGGILFGVGMALSGFCPGTIAAGAGEGRLDYLIPGVVGLVAGALGFGALYPWLLPILRGGELGVTTLPALMGAEPWLVILVLVEVFGLVVYALERPARRARGQVDD
jgi:uncharacterized membrane protein YedE/YeeE